MKRFVSTFVTLVLSAILPFGVVRAIDADSLQERISIGAMAYDDGFGVLLSNPSGIWYDREAQEVFVADAGNGRVLVYDRQLNCLYSFLHYVRDPGSGRTLTGEPKTLAVNRQGEILLIDARSERLDLLDFRGRPLDDCLPSRLLGDTTLHVKASAVAADDHDNFYILVTGDITRVLVVDRDLKLVRQFGEAGELPAQLSTPLTIAVHNSRIYVGDLRGTPAVKIYDTLGQFITGFGGHDVQRQDLSFPVGFGFLSDGTGGELILVGDGLRQVIKVYTAEGEFITMIGGAGTGPGMVEYPSGLVTADSASFYVVERVGGRVQKYEIK